jgi:hypothetical protein
MTIIATEAHKKKVRITKEGELRNADCGKKEKARRQKSEVRV